MPRQSCHAVPTIATQYSNMPDHKVGLAVMSRPDRTGVAVAVVRSSSGEVIAVDGWYNFSDGELPQDAPALSGGLWDEWEDMPARLLWRYNMPWVESLRTYLLPHYSTSLAAAQLIAHWAHDSKLPDVRQADLVAYFPVGDFETLLDHLRQIADDAAAKQLNYLQENATLGLDLLS